MKFPAFSPEEIEALHMAVRYLARQEGTPFKHLAEIERKLQKYFTREIREKLKKKIEYSGPETYSKLTELLNIIDEAINQNMKLVIHYKPTFHNVEIIRNIMPFSLHPYEYEWYLRGFCFQDKKVKTFSINQIVTMRCEKLTSPEKKLLPEKSDDKPEHRWDWHGPDITGEKIKVRIKFAGPMAAKMKKKTEFKKEHPTQETEIKGDDFIVSYEGFSSSSPQSFVAWVSV